MFNLMDSAAVMGWYRIYRRKSKVEQETYIQWQCDKSFCRWGAIEQICVPAGAEFLPQLPQVSRHDWYRRHGGCRVLQHLRFGRHHRAHQQGMHPTLILLDTLPCSLDLEY